MSDIISYSSLWCIHKAMEKRFWPWLQTASQARGVSLEGPQILYWVCLGNAIPSCTKDNNIPNWEGQSQSILLVTAKAYYYKGLKLFFPVVITTIHFSSSLQKGRYGSSNEKCFALRFDFRHSRWHFVIDNDFSPCSLLWGCWVKKCENPWISHCTYTKLSIGLITPELHKNLSLWIVAKHKKSLMIIIFKVLESSSQVKN